MIRGNSSTDKKRSTRNKSIRVSESSRRNTTLYPIKSFVRTSNLRHDNLNGSSQIPPKNLIDFNSFNVAEHPKLQSRSVGLKPSDSSSNARKDDHIGNQEMLTAKEVVARKTIASDSSSLDKASNEFHLKLFVQRNRPSHFKTTENQFFFTEKRVSTAIPKVCTPLNVLLSQSDTEPSPKEESTKNPQKHPRVQKRPRTYSEVKNTEHFQVPRKAINDELAKRFQEISLMKNNQKGLIPLSNSPLQGEFFGTEVKLAVKILPNNEPGTPIKARRYKIRSQVRNKCLRFQDGTLITFNEGSIPSRPLSNLLEANSEQKLDGVEPFKIGTLSENDLNQCRDRSAGSKIISTQNSQSKLANTRNFLDKPFHAHRQYLSKTVMNSQPPTTFNTSIAEFMTQNPGEADKRLPSHIQSTYSQTPSRIDMNKNRRNRLKSSAILKLKKVVQSIKNLHNSFSSPVRFPARPLLNNLTFKFMEAAKKGDTEVLRKMLDDQSNILHTEYDSLRQTALHLTTMNNHLEASESLVAAGANVNAVDIFGRTPLFNAIRNKNLSLVYLLLVFNASPWARKEYSYCQIAEDQEQILYYLKLFQLLNALLRLVKPEKRLAIRQIFVYTQTRVLKCYRIS